MNKEFIEKIRESGLWDNDYKDMDDFIDNGLMKNEIIPELPKLIANIVRTGDMMKSMGDRQLGKLDLSIPQKNVIEALYFHKKEYITQEQLSKFVYTSKANMSSLLERMEKKGYIKREENRLNKREKKVILTQKGKNKYTELIAIMQKYNTMGFDGIVTKQEAQIANKVLYQIREFQKNIDQQLQNEKR